MSNLISDVNSIHGFFATYEQLLRENRIFSEIDRWSKCCNVDIYIDMNSATKELFYNRPPINGGAEIASTILNLCGHYREYYRRYHQCETRFFIIYSINRPKNCVQIFDEYNSPNVMKQLAKPVIYDMIMKACSQLNAICKYIPDVFFLYSDYETSVTIYDSIEQRQQKPYPSIIISKDPLVYSVIAFSNNCLMLRPHKSKAGETDKVKKDKSYFIRHNEALCYAIHEYTKKISMIDRELNPELISMIYTLCGCPQRNIQTFLSISETTKLLYDAIQWGDIINGYNMAVGLYDKLGLSKFGVSIKDINDRFIMMDLPTQLNIMRNELALSVDNYDLQVVNIEDPDKVKYFNNTEFANCPVYLDRL